MKGMDHVRTIQASGAIGPTMERLLTPSGLQHCPVVGRTAHRRHLDMARRRRRPRRSRIRFDDMAPPSPRPLVTVSRLDVFSHSRNLETQPRRSGVRSLSFGLTKKAGCVIYRYRNQLIGAGMKLGPSVRSGASS